MSGKRIVNIMILLSLMLPILAEAAIPTGLSFPALTVNNNNTGGQTYSVTLQVLLFMTALTVLPGLIMAMTAFTRIIIVLTILRQAMGMAQTPTNQILIGIALFMTFFVMSPVFKEVNYQALQPYLQGKLAGDKALMRAQVPVRKFMLNQTRDNDINLFSELSGKQYNTLDDVPIYVIIPAFVTSELKTAFQMGFILFLPFLVIDIVVASVLMSMGMMMLSPLIISLPFKVLLFVLVDGWTLVLGTLASSFSV